MPAHERALVKFHGGPFDGLEHEARTLHGRLPKAIRIKADGRSTKYVFDRDGTPPVFRFDGVTLLPHGA